MSESEDDVNVPIQPTMIDKQFSESSQDKNEAKKEVLLNVGGSLELTANFKCMQESEYMGECKHPDSTDRTSQQITSPPPIDNTTTVNSKAAEASAQSYRKASIILPYNGELYPPENLNAAQTYVSILEMYQNAVLKLEPLTNNPLQTVFKMVSTKLEDLKESRRFQLKNFDATSVSRIGGGRFGNIFKQKLMDSSEVALKLFKESCNTAAIYKEVHMLIALQNKRIVKILGAFHENGTWLVMELCLGNIREYLKELTRRQKVRFGIQILEAVDYVHSRNIIHCDIRPENVLLTTQNNVVLGGFSTANLLPKGVRFIRSPSRRPCLGSKGYSDSLANDSIYSKSTDMFGVGCTIFEMDCGYPLMEYPGWPDAPSEEYIRCVRQGRLVLSPFVTPDAQLLEQDGERETLLERSKRSDAFGEVLHELIQDSHRRPYAAFILEKYKTFFSISLKEVNSSFEQLDNDALPDGWTLTPGVRVAMPSHDVSPDTNIAMDLIYWDTKMNQNTEAETHMAHEQHITAVQADNLQSCIKQFVASNSFLVKKSGNDHLLAPVECDSALKVPVCKNVGTCVKLASDHTQVVREIQELGAKEYAPQPRIGLENPHPTASKCAPKPTTGTSTKDNLETFKSHTEVKLSSSSLDCAKNIAPSPNKTLIGRECESVGEMAATHKNGGQTEKDPVSRKRKRAQDDSLSQQKSWVSEQTSCDQTMENHNDQHKKKKKKSHKKSKQAEKHHSIANEQKIELPLFEMSNSCNSKEQFIASNQYVQVELRGTPPTPTNLPEDFIYEDDWSRWFDCGEPCPYYTSDYIEIMDHMDNCLHRNE